MTFRVSFRGLSGWPASNRDVAPSERAWLVVPRLERHLWAVLASVAAVPLCYVCALTLDGPVARLAIMVPLWLRATAEVLTRFGLSGYMLVISGVLAAVAYILVQPGRSQHGNRPLALVGERAFFVFVAVAGSGILVQLFKHLVGRSRPKFLETLGTVHFDFFSIKASLASFPSGHATSIFALAVALGSIMPRIRTAGLVLAGLVATSRLILGAHFLSDVLAGAALGCLVTFVLRAVFAERSIAFAVYGKALRLKGRGEVFPALRAWARSPRTAV